MDKRQTNNPPPNNENVFHPLNYPNIPNFLPQNFHPSMINFGSPQFSMNTLPPIHENSSNVTNPFMMYQHPAGYVTQMLGNNFHPGLMNMSMSSPTPSTPTSMIREVHSRSDSQSATTPTGSTSQSPFPPYSNQCAVENIAQSQAQEKRNYESWSKDEDILLAQSWLTISNDSITGNFQDNQKFWKWITTYYNDNRGSFPRREQSKCKTHWHAYIKLVNEFSHIFNKLWDEHKSGWNDEQIKQTARDIFHQQKGRNFVYEHVWNTVKNDPKWKAISSVEGSNKRSKNNEFGVYTSSSNAETSADINDIEEEVRPIGQKAAKKGKRKGKTKANANDDNGVEEILEAQRKVEELEAKKLAVQQEYNQIYKRHAVVKEYEILLKDTSRMTE